MPIYCTSWRDCLIFYSTDLIPIFSSVPTISFISWRWYQTGKSDSLYKTITSPDGRHPQKVQGVTFSPRNLPPPSVETQFLTPRRKYLRGRKSGDYQLKFESKAEDRWDINFAEQEKNDSVKPGSKSWLFTWWLGKNLKFIKNQEAFGRCLMLIGRMELWAGKMFECNVSSLDIWHLTPGQIQWWLIQTFHADYISGTIWFSSTSCSRDSLWLSHSTS